MTRPPLAIRGGARSIAADVVARVLDDGAWAQPALASALSTSALDARDKALCTELAYGALRWAVPLEKSLLRSADKPGKGLDKRVRPHLLIAAYQLQHLSDRIPAHAAVSEAVEAIKHARPGLDGFSNALLRRLGSPLHALLTSDATLHERADAYGIPHLLADAISRVLPEAEHTEALAGLNARPTTYAYALGAVPESAAPHAFVPGAFVLDGGAVTGVEGFKDGRWVVLDPGSTVAALLVGAKEGMHVLDLCAAPGGKTMVLARAVGGGTGDAGRVTAVEQSERRAERIRENGKRTRLAAHVDVVVADAITAKLPVVDAVLLDAPCTGLGTTRRKPEIKLHRTAADVEKNAALQSALLDAAAKLVRPGGVLVYSVCSPLLAEGEAQIDRVLAAHPELVLENARKVLPWLPENAVDARGCVRLFPHRHDADAFFCARMRRSPEEKS